MAASIPNPTRPSPVRDDHVWKYPSGGRELTRVRRRVWPTDDGGYLAIVTDLLAGASVVNTAELLHQALTTEYGQVTVVQHYPPGTFAENHRDRFSQITLDTTGVPQWDPCTDDILRLLGVQVLGYPGDQPPGPADTDQPLIPPASVHLTTLLAASLRLDEAGHQVRQDMDPETVLALTIRALGGIASIVRNADIGPGEYLNDELDAELDLMGNRISQAAADLDELHRKILFFYRKGIPAPGPGLRERVRRAVEPRE